MTWHVGSRHGRLTKRLTGDVYGAAWRSRREDLTKTCDPQIGSTGGGACPGFRVGTELGDPFVRCISQLWACMELTIAGWCTCVGYWLRRPGASVRGA